MMYIEPCVAVVVNLIVLSYYSADVLSGINVGKNCFLHADLKINLRLVELCKSKVAWFSFVLFLQRKRGANFRAIISVATSIGSEVKGQWREQELNPRDLQVYIVVHIFLQLCSFVPNP